MTGARVILGDCRDVLPTFEAGTFDAIVTDPPAGISFMGKEWDRFGGRANGNAERDRAAGKGRGPINARNPHGKDTQPFGYSGSALPTGPAQRAAFIDFLTGILAECYRVAKPGARLLCWSIPRTSHWTGTAVEDAGWQIENVVAHLFGSGFPKGRSQLKPAREDWWLARRPGPKVLPLNVDSCRVPTTDKRAYPNGPGGKSMHYSDQTSRGSEVRPEPWEMPLAGRYPANVTHDGSPEVLEAFAAFGERPSRPGATNHDEGHTNTYGWSKGGIYKKGVIHDDTGTAARFFYCAKSSRADRGPGNTHPTVKSVALCEWLTRLICPPGGTVLDPFMGSGSIGVASVNQGFGFIGIEKVPEYLEIAKKRIDGVVKKSAELLPFG